MTPTAFEPAPADKDKQDVIHHVENTNDAIERIEQVADLVQLCDNNGLTGPDLCKDRGARARCVEVDAPNQHIAEAVCMASEERTCNPAAAIQAASVRSH